MYRPMKMATLSFRREKKTSHLPCFLFYDIEMKTKNTTTKGQTFELITMNEDGTITFKQQDGTPVTVSPDLQGMISARQANSQSMFASR